MIFFPVSRHIVFRLQSWPFCLNSFLFCNYFTLLLLLSHFLSPFFLFLSPFFLFLLRFSPFFSSPFHILSPKWHRLIILPGGGIFQYRGPCCSNFSKRISDQFFGAIGLSILDSHLENYRIIRYEIKNWNDQTIDYQTLKKLWVARLC